MEQAVQLDAAVPAATMSKAPWAALVVDDDAGVRQSLRLCLEAAGASVGCRHRCKQIVELHGGEISCGSGRNDRGTCITVTLPGNSAGRLSVVGESATTESPVGG